MKVRGYVINGQTGRPVDDANVTITTQLSTTTDSSGLYEIAGVSVGLHIIIFDATGYVPVLKNFEASHGNEVTINAKLKPLIQIGGTFHDATGVASADYTVGLIIDGTSVVDVTCDGTTGAFEFPLEESYSALLAGMFALSCDATEQGTKYVICKVIDTPELLDDFLWMVMTAEGRTIDLAIAAWNNGVVSEFNMATNLTLAGDIMPG